VYPIKFGKRQYHKRVQSYDNPGFLSLFFLLTFSNPVELTIMIKDIVYVMGIL